MLPKCLKEQQAAGNQANNNWKKVVWVAASAALVGSEQCSQGVLKTAISYKDHWSTVLHSKPGRERP